MTDIPGEEGLLALLLNYGDAMKLQGENPNFKKWKKRATTFEEKIMDIFRTLKNSNKELRDTIERYRERTEFLETSSKKENEALKDHINYLKDSLECHEDALKEMEEN